MMKKSFFLTLAAGLLASLAFTAPSQAGSVVTTTLGFASISPGASTIVIEYVGAGTITNVLPELSGPTDATEALTGPHEITVTFASSTNGPEVVAFTFDSTTPYAIAPGVISVSSATASPGGQTILTHLSFNLGAVPEPASFAMLGIGMTGLLAFRRYFKRNSAA